MKPLKPKAKRARAKAPVATCLDCYFSYIWNPKLKSIRDCPYGRAGQLHCAAPVPIWAAKYVSATRVVKEREAAQCESFMPVDSNGNPV